MSIYDKRKMDEILAGNDYQGRGIVIGKTPDGTKAGIAYFIMGRSENSRNRVFVKEGDDVMIYPFDESKVEDPSLIIYAPVRTLGNNLIVTNGDQTDTIRDFVKEGRSFKAALETREFEPDGPNWTPRISGMLTFGANIESRGDFTYEMSILKSIDPVGSACARYTWSYPSDPGLGHFIHTYETNGNPLPTFQGEPRRVEMPGTARELAEQIWYTLNEDNKISLYVRYTDLLSGEYEDILINKNAK
ncbi:MAG: IMP cyclohydrolase [Firmicutes bacterium]|nr:IMP cyclohydrolase [Bacillota bacterium]